MHSGDASSVSCRDPNYDTIALSLQTSLMLGWRWCEELNSQNRAMCSYCMVWIALPAACSAHLAFLQRSAEIRYGWAGDARYSVLPLRRSLTRSFSFWSELPPFLPSLFFLFNHIQQFWHPPVRDQMSNAMVCINHGSVPAGWLLKGPGKNILMCHLGFRIYVKKDNWNHYCW